MSLSASALTTVATVIDELELADAADAKVRARLERYVEAASAFIVGVCGRPLAHEAARVDHLRGFGGARLILPLCPVLSIASVVVDDVAVDAADYEIEDAAAGLIYSTAGWPDTSARAFSPSEHRIPGSEAPSIVVTYAGGWVTPNHASLTRTLPYDLEDAAVQLVVTRWRGRGADLRVAAESKERSSRTFGGAPIPPEVMAILDRYTRIGAA